MSKNSSRNAASRLITSRSNGGFNASHRYSSTRHDHADTASGTAGSLMRPTSKSPESGNTSTALSTNMARWSTCTCRNDATSRRRHRSKPQCCRLMAAQKMSPPIWLHRCCALSMGCSRMRCMAPPGTRTIGSRTTTAASKHEGNNARVANRSDGVKRDPRPGFVQNLHRGHDELGVDASGARLRLAAAFGKLAQAT